jgi:hypothetical protein
MLIANVSERKIIIICLSEQLWAPIVDILTTHTTAYRCYGEIHICYGKFITDRLLLASYSYHRTLPPNAGFQHNPRTL